MNFFNLLKMAELNKSSIPQFRREGGNYIERENVMIPDNEIRVIPGDGNCCPVAISEGMPDIEVNGQVIRKTVVDFMENNRNYFSQFIPSNISWDDYLANMRVSGRNFDNLEIAAAENIVNENGYTIKIWQKDEAVKTYVRRDQHGKKDLRAINLIYSGDGYYGHYDLWVKDLVNKCFVENSPYTFSRRQLGYYEDDNSNLSEGYKSYMRLTTMVNNNTARMMGSEYQRQVKRIDDLEQKMNNIQMLITPLQNSAGTITTNGSNNTAPMIAPPTIYSSSVIPIGPPAVPFGMPVGSVQMTGAILPTNIVGQSLGVPNVGVMHPYMVYGP